ncbi:MAG: phosphodiesterase, partial [Burkholderiales bacterium]
VIEDFPVRVIVLDTHVAGREGGLLDSSRLSWLEARLSEAPRRPTIVFMHHPPFQTGIEGMDEINCGGAGELEKIIRKNPQVERIACGHVHRPIQTRWAGTAACIAPSTAHQIALDLREHEELRYVIEPSGFLLHVWRPEMGLVTHTVWVDDFPGPYSFS